MKFIRLCNDMSICYEKKSFEVGRESFQISFCNKRIGVGECDGDWIIYGLWKKVFSTE